MPSLSNSVDVYADKVYLPVSEGVVDLGETVGAKADHAETYTISTLNEILDSKIDDSEFIANNDSIATSLANKADKNNTYTKSEVDTTFSNLINSAPAALNQLSELASALANDANYATTVQNQLALKAPLQTPPSQEPLPEHNLR